MKKTIFVFALVIGVGMMRMDSAFGQTMGFPGTTPITNQFSPLTNQFAPLTNQLGFTNTLVLTNNPSEVPLTNFATLLLSLQTNIEETLPVLALATSNATPANTLNNQQPFGPNIGPVVPITSNPQGLTMPPTGAASGTNSPSQASFTLTFGTNVVVIDQETLQALITLRDDLAGTLPVLQQLNGTTPQALGIPGAPTTIVTPPFTPLTNPTVPTPTNGFFFRPLTGLRFNP